MRHHKAKSDVKSHDTTLASQIRHAAQWALHRAPWVLLSQFLPRLLHRLLHRLLSVAGCGCADPLLIALLRLGQVRVLWNLHAHLDHGGRVKVIVLNGWAGRGQTEWGLADQQVVASSCASAQAQVFCFQWNINTKKISVHPQQQNKTKKKEPKKKQPNVELKKGKERKGTLAL